MSKKLVADSSAGGATAKAADIYQICPKVRNSKAEVNRMSKK